MSRFLDPFSLEQNPKEETISEKIIREENEIWLRVKETQRSLQEALCRYQSDYETYKGLETYRLDVERVSKELERCCQEKDEITKKILSLIKNQDQKPK